MSRGFGTPQGGETRDPNGVWYVCLVPVDGLGNALLWIDRFRMGLYPYIREVMSSRAGDSGRASESSDEHEHDDSDDRGSAHEDSEFDGETSDDRSEASTSEAGSFDFEDIDETAESMDVDFVTDDDVSDAELF